MTKNKSFIVSAYLGGALGQKEKRLVRSFLGAQHILHCRHLLGTKHSSVYKYVGRRMDKRIGGGRKHRSYGHNEGFLRDNFAGEKEVLAASLHLLGDFVSDILIDVLRYVLGEIKTGRIKPPYYESYGNSSSWDLKKNVIHDMKKKWAKVYIESLRMKNRRIGV